MKVWVGGAVIAVLVIAVLFAFHGHDEVAAPVVASHSPTPAAHRAVAAPTSVSGHVRDNGMPLADARVCSQVGSRAVCAATDPSGAYRLVVQRGQQWVFAGAAQHRGAEHGVVVDGAIEGIDFELDRADTREVTGTIHDRGGPIAGALVRVNDEPMVETDVGRALSRGCRSEERA
ncbi:MAG: hypothetical protein QM831_34075 [Kofleriaceae bacterium]